MNPVPAATPETSLLHPPLPAKGQQRGYWRAPHGSGLALAIASLAREHAGIVLAVARDTQSAHRLETEIGAFANADTPVLHFPDWETLPYDLFSPHPDIVSQRIATLYRLPGVTRGVLVVPIATLMQRLAPRAFIAGSNFEVAVGDRFDVAAERRRLDGAGYRHVPQVLEPGDYATRGSLIDLYPMGAAEPYRIELFDEQIETIRTFDPETQRSLERTASVSLLSAREFPLTETATKAFRATLRERFPIDPRRCPIYQDIQEGVAPAGVEYYLPLFFDKTETLFDYLGAQALVVATEGALDAAEAFWANTVERYEQRRHDIERPAMPPGEIYLDPSLLRERLNRVPRIEVVANPQGSVGAFAPPTGIPAGVASSDASVGAFAPPTGIPAGVASSDAAVGAFAPPTVSPSGVASKSASDFPLQEDPFRARADQVTVGGAKAPTAAAITAGEPPTLIGTAHDLGTQPAPSVPLSARDTEPGAALKSFLASYRGRVLLSTDSPGRREALIEQLGSYDARPQAVASWHAFLAGDVRYAITVTPIEDGFALRDPALCLLTERQLFGERVQQQRRRKRAGRDPEAIIKDLGELALGAPVVHEDHGVGRYRGLEKLEVGGAPGEFLAIEYAKGDKLYVPVAQLHLVSRYTGTAPEFAPLHALGGDAWDRAKRKAAEKVRDVAAELLEIYAKREARVGTSITLDEPLYEQFAAGFPFEETPDQQSAIDAVLADLAREKPMDRVVCGDVGFGKTEVAVRAAFAVAQAGQQVALLVPTTLLAQQHYQNFRDRYADWPIRVEVLSRFRSKKETDEAIRRIGEGTIDVVIGTHKLLQGDVKFKSLGLVIVDEEHRFGVRQKEQLKKLRAEVDLLTLTATPIPRTLNMAMAGMRDLSIIATPPAHRVAVQTFVTPWDAAMLREAFQRELSRGGQVYFLHNEVESIERMARDLAELVPAARIRIAHGQMPERELENVMLDFYRQRFNVLVCSTIIESGIDVPSANTIVINRADRFGLAQLHQLRGRVGRSHHRAYAYLVVPDRKSITADAKKRLDAIESLDELGAGFTLATHDLEIRGAGELLGEEQSGQIQEVGFSLYTDLLERAVRALKEGRIPDLDASERAHTEVELHVPSLIPDDYLGDVHTRLVLYKRIASAPGEDLLHDLQAEMVDRFGLLPDPTKNLFAAAQLRLRAAALGIRKLELGAHGGRVLFHPQPKVDALTIIKMIQLLPKVYALDGPDKLKVRLELPGAAERIRAAGDILTAMSRTR